MSEDLVMNPIVIQTVDTYRHDYWKISLTLLSELNLFTEITEYSYLGKSNEPLNELGYAYLEIDCDCNTFETAMNFYGKRFTLDFVDLQAIYEEESAKYDDEFDGVGCFNTDWFSNLDNFDTEILKELGYDVKAVPDDLSAALQEIREKHGH
jgi:hypothetical protein